MFICTKEFIAGLHTTTEDARRAMGAKLLKDTPATTGLIRVLVLADLHLQDADGERFSDRIAQVREWFRWQKDETKWDAMVVAGDLIAANTVGWRNATPAILLAACHDRLAALHKRAGEELAKELAINRILVVPGNHDVVRKGGSKERRVAMSEMLRDMNLHQTSSFATNVELPLLNDKKAPPKPDQPAPRLLLLGGADSVIGIIGLDSNQMAYQAPGLDELGYIGSEQLDQVERLVAALKEVYKDRPLFLWATWHHHLLPVYNTEQVDRLLPKMEGRDPEAKELLGVFDAIMVDGKRVVDRLCDLNVSLAMHGHMHAASSQRVSYSPRTEQVLSIVACPACMPTPDPEHPFVGATVVEFDLARGLAQAFITGVERTPIGGGHYQNTPFTKNFAISLIPASRVPLGEMRLFRHLESWLDGKQPAGGGRIGVFERNVPRPRENRNKETNWEQSVAQCLSQPGYVPVCMGSPEDVLASGLFTHEDIALLPRKKYKLLLALNRSHINSYNILMNNFFPLRTTEYGSWDMPLLPAFKSLHGLVAGWLRDVRRRLDDYRELEMRGERVSDEIKILEETLNEQIKNETNDDELVTLATKQFVKFSPTDGIPTIYEYHLTVWPALASETNSDLCRFLAHYANELKPGDVEYQSFRNYPRGLVWLPLSKWRDSAAITARNQDVMQWVENLIGKLSKSMGSAITAPPQWMVLGSGHGLKTDLSNPRLMPFDSAVANGSTTTAPAAAPFPASLRDGLDKVQVGQQTIYQGQTIYNGVLRVAQHGTRIGITVNRLDEKGNETLIGYLRPVQRYVLRQGLRRAEQLRNSILASSANSIDIAKLGQDQAHGYVNVTLPGNRDIAILPLIVEKIADSEKEGETDEFILCDGNHRLVQYLLLKKCDAVGCAIVIDEPKQPYYAWPYSRWDWHILLQNQLETTPDRYAKYTPRHPSGTTIESIQKNPDSYRQFFRYLGTGFADIGEQGGKYM